LEKTQSQRRYPVGAEFSSGKGVSFRVWAPAVSAVRLFLEDGPGAPQHLDLRNEQNGYFSLCSDSAAPGTHYRFELGDDSKRVPDPISRFQPNGPHGVSVVIDPLAFPWTDSAFPGVQLEGQIIYEMHVGTFTRQGNWSAATEQLNELAEIGITLIEVMPIADFPGRFGWGYDGVGMFAPTWLYGEPDDMRRFVDTAHSVGIGVILDVVYNHFGPDGNYLNAFSPDYFNDIQTDWGEAINFDGKNSGPVREFFLSNARYWIDEFHLDGLRLDATQDIHDSSKPHILTEIADVVRKTAGKRGTVLIAENEPQETDLVRCKQDGGIGLDALWNDDFHHSSLVALTGRNEAYYTDYKGNPQEFIAAVKYGYLYQGQWYRWQKARRGTAALDLSPAAFVTFIQNHDQIANTARGERPNLLATAGKYKAMTALLLLAPGTPMLFQGQEFAATTPFLYFCDHQAELSKMVRDGRAKFLAQFRSLALPEMQHVFGDPGNPSTFESCKLDFSERQKNTAMYSLHKDLIALRKQDPVFSQQKRGAVDGAVVSSDAFILRYFGGEHGDRLLLVNFGRDLHLDPAPEPLLAPPPRSCWVVICSTEDPKYGGYGTFPPESEDNWRLPGNSCIALRSERSNEKIA
jgi:maltooligosyltrehalose trehalohydrolase